MTKEEKLALYNEAKKAYYEGNDIMSDTEFDELEQELGLENKSYIGTRHNPSYTIEHPFKMGSLSKVQIHEKNGIIDWNKYEADAFRYIQRSCINDEFEIVITPKYDGCSFEAIIEDKVIKSISTRGDGAYGKSIFEHILSQVTEAIKNIDNGTYCLRGEVLVDKDVYTEKYTNFTNPRSFVAGLLNRKYEDIEDKSILNDLDIVIYDIRIFTDNGWVDTDWMDYGDKIGCLPYKYYTASNVFMLDDIYADFAEYRKNCKYALDGFVIKPTADYRKNNLTEARPEDCVAIKFIPMLEETEVIDITWNLGKSGEYTPIIWVNPVEMDGRMVGKCSGFNYGYLKENKVSIGTKVIMSLAGDIIPYLYKITNTDAYDENKMNLPNGYADGIHYIANLSEEEHCKQRFVISSDALNISSIGEQTAKDIFDYVTKTYGETDEFFGEAEVKDIPNNILLISPEDVFFGAGSGKLGKNAQRGFTEMLKTLTLAEVIRSCSFELCGHKAAEQIQNYLIGEEYSFSHLPGVSYNWVYNKESDEMKQINKILDYLGKSYDDFKQRAVEIKQVNANQIPVILTGEPNDYKSKGEFLKYHPEYRQTTSWKEVQIVFTNSLESNTGKMKKAREKNIEIRLY